MLKNPANNNDGASISFALKELAGRLTDSGYCEYYACFNPIYPNYQHWAAHRDDAPKHLWNIIDLFMLGKEVEHNKIDGFLSDLIDPLMEWGILSESKDKKVSTTDLVLLPMFGFWLFFQKPQINPILYFGEDSIALMMRLRPERNEQCLDLCAGPGFQSIYSSLFSAKVTSVEINPLASALASMNVLINKCEEKIELLRGDLYAPVRGRTFDRIIANPPLLPFPDEIPYPFVGHGGYDGMRVTWRILEGLPAYLTKSGTAQIIGTCLSDGILPLCTDELHDWAVKNHLNITFTVTSHKPLHPGSKMFDGLVHTAASAQGLDHQYVANTYKKSLDDQGATHLCAYYLNARFGGQGLMVQDVSREEYSGFWYI